jgi:hypothetical protein
LVAVRLLRRATSSGHRQPPFASDGPCLVLFEIAARQRWVIMGNYPMSLSSLFAFDGEKDGAVTQVSAVVLPCRITHPLANLLVSHIGRGDAVFVGPLGARGFLGGVFLRSPPQQPRFGIMPIEPIIQLSLVQSLMWHRGTFFKFCYANIARRHGLGDNLLGSAQAAIQPCANRLNSDAMSNPILWVKIIQFPSRGFEAPISVMASPL